MVKIPYWQQLQDPRWQEARLRILERAGFRCEVCSEKPEWEGLEIHHRYYQKGLMAWEYPPEALVSVCKKCHEIAADSERDLILSIPPDEISHIKVFVKAIKFARENELCLIWCTSQIASAVGSRLAENELLETQEEPR